MTPQDLNADLDWEGGWEDLLEHGLALAEDDLTPELLAAVRELDAAWSYYEAARSAADLALERALEDKRR